MKLKLKKLKLKTKRLSKRKQSDRETDREMEGSDMRITDEKIAEFKRHLKENEKSLGTITHYVHAVKALQTYLNGGEVIRERLVLWKEEAPRHYSIRSANAMIAGINAFLRFCGSEECSLKAFRYQRKPFLREKLTEADVKKLMRSAKRRKDATGMVLVAILSETGIRVSELRSITVEAVREGVAVITLKGKTREILLSRDLQKMLERYIELRGLTKGPILLDKRGKPMDRRRVWELLKKLCEGTGVDPKLVHPHAFRHLFARVFYSLCRDMAKLADILGHSSVDTTRIYLADTIDVHRGWLDRVSEDLCLSRRFSLEL